MYHPAPPINAKQDATGVIKGTISHFSRPFPQLSATLENGLITSVEGGGEYGAAWRELMTETEEIHYPDFPRPGLFWLWEIAVGTNPKVRRTSNIEMVSSGGTEWERGRSGVIHMGFGTSGPSDCEHWAGERGYAYGHLHMHMMFPTVEIIHADGSVEVPVKNGHLAALDDPEVRECAAKYGDPDVLLKEDWIPEIPGVSMPGSYSENCTRAIRSGGSRRCRQATSRTELARVAWSQTVPPDVTVVAEGTAAANRPDKRAPAQAPNPARPPPALRSPPTGRRSCESTAPRASRSRGAHDQRSPVADTPDRITEKCASNVHRPVQRAN